MQVKLKTHSEMSETLFGERHGVYSDRDITQFKGMFELIGYRMYFPNINFFSVGGVIMLEPNYDAPTKKFIPIQHWVRPYRTLMQDAITNYPRPPIPTIIQGTDLDSIVQRTIKSYVIMEMYFLVIVPRINNTFLFWLDKYENIPIKHWYPNPYNKKANRLLLSRDTKEINYNFVTLDVLKNQLQQIFA